jgi:hypothetical protein
MTRFVFTMVHPDGSERTVGIYTGAGHARRRADSAYGRDYTAKCALRRRRLAAPEETLSLGQVWIEEDMPDYLEKEAKELFLKTWKALQPEVIRMGDALYPEDVVEAIYDNLGSMAYGGTGCLGPAMSLWFKCNNRTTATAWGKAVLGESQAVYTDQAK